MGENESTSSAGVSRSSSFATSTFVADQIQCSCGNVPLRGSKFCNQCGTSLQLRRREEKDSPDVRLLKAIVEGEEIEDASDFDAVMRLQVALQQAGKLSTRLKHDIDEDANKSKAK